MFLLSALDPGKNGMEIMKKIKMVVVGFLVLLASMSILSCSEMRSEFDPHQWHYEPFDNTPPSWENDFGRPDDPESYGEESW